MMTGAPGRSQVLSLYKQFIKNSRNFNNYNFREYFLRRAREEFRKNASVTDPAQASELYSAAKQDLGTLKRQSIISQMYTFDKLVVEPIPKEH